MKQNDLHRGLQINWRNIPIALIDPGCERNRLWILVAIAEQASTEVYLRE